MAPFVIVWASWHFSVRFATRPGVILTNMAATARGHSPEWNTGRIDAFACVRDRISFVSIRLRTGWRRWGYARGIAGNEPL